MSGIQDLIKQLANGTLGKSSVSVKHSQLQKEVIGLFMESDRLTIAQISHSINTSLPKVKELVDEFLKNRLISDLGKEVIGVGRKPNFYGLNPDAGYFLTVEVHRHKIVPALMNFKKIIHIGDSIPFELKNTKAAFEQLCESISSYIKSQKQYRNKILGIALTITGRVNHESGVSYSFFNFHNKPLTEVLTERFDIPAYIENDTRAMAYGEFSMGCVTNEKNVLFLNLDEGIGMGIIVNGALYSGKSGFAGEFGHLTILPNDIICHCGKKGCLETEASGAALVRQIYAEIEEGTTTILTEIPDVKNICLDDLVNAALKDDTLCIDLIAQAGEKIGKGIAFMLNLFNPELVILGGELARSGSLIVFPILSTINKHSLSLVNTDTEFKTSKLGKEAGLIGASLLLRNKLFQIHQ